MATPNSAKILELSHVAPYTDSPDSATEFSLPLTFFDTFWFKFPPVERLFFYSLPETKDSSFNAVLPKLKHSLSLTLRYFLPLAGTLTWPRDSPKPVILYTPGDAVSVAIAESDADFDLLAGNHARQAAMSGPLVPLLRVSETGASVVALQITVFPNSGFCIGVTTHHAVLDGKSTTMFMKSWAYLCKENPPLLPELIPFYDRSIIKDPSGVDMRCLNKWLGNSETTTSSTIRNNPKLFEFSPILDVPSDLFRATFELSRSDIDKMRQRVSSSWDKSSSSPKTKLHLSSFVLTFAYVLDCILKATEGDETKRKVYTAFTADYRSRLEPPVPGNYFGNCVGGKMIDEELREKLSHLEGERGEEEEEGLTALVEKISCLVKELEKDIDANREAEEMLSKLLSIVSEKAYAVGVAGSPRFGVYSIDFGWDRPKKVDIVSAEKTGAISMAESRDGNGSLEVGLALKKHQMDLFASLFLAGLRKF
ncbi:Transferase [Parasponia andersonii]|uniref:Transferase n=1 Tax=Parasponia andersonii TaxID=3476 RepID=A0A2P5BBM6_PARAD|nr:Transferase [Parasponia andersonii]